MLANWFLTNESHPTNIQNNLVNLDYIQHYLDGTEKKNFDHTQPRTSLQIRDVTHSQSTTVKDQARHSFAGSTSTEELQRRDYELEKDLRNFKLQGVQTDSQVSYP